MQQAEKKDLTKKKEAKLPTTIDLESYAGQGVGVCYSKRSKTSNS